MWFCVLGIGAWIKVWCWTPHCISLSTELNNVASFSGLPEAKTAATFWRSKMCVKLGDIPEKHTWLHSVEYQKSQKWQIFCGMKVYNLYATMNLRDCDEFFFCRAIRRLKWKASESSRMQRTICILVLLVMRTAKIRPTPTDGCFRWLELEFFMQRAERSELLRGFQSGIIVEKSATSANTFQTSNTGFYVHIIKEFNCIYVKAIVSFHIITEWRDTFLSDNQSLLDSIQSWYMWLYLQWATTEHRCHIFFIRNSAQPLVFGYEFLNIVGRIICCICSCHHIDNSTKHIISHSH